MNKSRKVWVKYCPLVGICLKRAHTGRQSTLAPSSSISCVFEPHPFFLPSPPLPLLQLLIPVRPFICCRPNPARFFGTLAAAITPLVMGQLMHFSSRTLSLPCCCVLVGGGALPPLVRVRLGGRDQEQGRKREGLWLGYLQSKPCLFMS